MYIWHCEPVVAASADACAMKESRCREGAIERRVVPSPFNPPSHTHLISGTSTLVREFFFFFDFYFLILLHTNSKLEGIIIDVLYSRDDRRIWKRTTPPLSSLSHLAITPPLPQNHTPGACNRSVVKGRRRSRGRRRREGTVFFSLAGK